MKLMWSNDAINDLDSIFEYLREHDHDIAIKIVSYIINKSIRLINSPTIGRPGHKPGIRELVIDNYPYIVPYRIIKDEIHIVRIFHTSRKQPSTW